MTRVRKICSGSQIRAGLSGYLAAIGQSIICAELGLPDQIHDNHASYVANWITHLKNDKTALIKAASKAEQAVKWIRQNAAPAMLEAA